MFKGLIYSLISASAYGLLAIIIKLGYRYGLTAGDLLTYRFLGAALMLGLYLALRYPGLLKVRPRTIFKALLLGMVLYGIQGTCYFKALTYIPASTSALILYLYPLAVTAISVVVFKLRVTSRTLLSLALVMIGCACIFSDAFQRAFPLVGILYALGAMGAYSLYLITTQYFLRGEHPLNLTFYAILCTGLMFTVVFPPRPLSAFVPTQMGILFAIALIPTVIALTFLFRAIDEIGSARTSLFSTIEPVVTVSAAYFLLQEQIYLAQLFGMLLIIGGIVYPNLGSGRAAAAPSVDKPSGTPEDVVGQAAEPRDYQGS